VQASRYEGNKQFWTAYAFAQYQWTGRRADFSLGLRADHQSVYGSQISPKASGQYQILANKLWLKASVGRGFKAPDFRQLYLNFNNSLAGYMVLGTEELPAALTELQRQGQIAALLLSPDQTGRLQAESSWGYNLGLWYAPNARWSGSLNLFRNDVNNLIESQLVARKTNGQSIFSYRNLQRIYTQGLETDWNYQHRGWSLGLGYQALWAKDKAQVEAIAKGEVYRTDPQTFITTRVKSQDYFGLFGRSRHHLNLKAGYRQEKQKWDVYLRGIYRGPYGLGDRNGNLILDEASEFVEGFWLLNLSASKSLWQERVLLQAGVDNLLNHRDALNQPEFAGRLYWISLHFFLKP
jgi:outer membrane receptor for ferrienterochelin and colicins